MRSLTITLLVVLVTTSARAQLGWSAITPTSGPAARDGHALAFDSGRSRTVLFGGGDPALGDTWEWDGSVWTSVLPATMPAPRRDHAMVFDSARQCVLLFGGTDAAGASLGDTWSWDGIAWTQHAPGTTPPARGSHAMAFDPIRGVAVMFGGRQSSTGASLGDLWEWDGVDWTWRPASPAPASRHAHAMTFDCWNLEVVVTGGYIGNSGPAHTDSWNWDGAAWQMVSNTTPPRAGGALVYQVSDDSFTLFGGDHGTQLSTNTTWSMEIDGPWVLDERPAPSPRTSVAMAYDLTRDRTVMFGGSHDGSPLGDTWEYDSGGQAAFGTFGSSCPGSFGIPTLEVFPGERPVIGDPSFALELSQVSPVDPVFIAFGVSDVWFAGVTLPLDLSTFDAPGCALLTSHELIYASTSSGGDMYGVLPIPNNLAFVGAEVFAQGFGLDAAANAAGLVTSNGVWARLGVF